MQQVPKHEQGLFLHLAATMGRAYSLHTPLALPTALQRGTATIDHPYRPGPFYLLMPMNTQAAWLSDFNLEELPEALPVSLGAAAGNYARQPSGFKRRAALSSRWVVAGATPAPS